jgi:hypothetical protein
MRRMESWLWLSNLLLQQCFGKVNGTCFAVHFGRSFVIAVVAKDGCEGIPPIGIERDCDYFEMNDEMSRLSVVFPPSAQPIVPTMSATQAKSV